MKRFLKVLFYVIAALYPILIFTFLVILKSDIKIVSLCMIALAAAFFLSATGKKKTEVGKEKSALDWKPLISSMFFFLAGLFCFITGRDFFLKIYSVVINLTFLIIFGSTLFFKPNIIFRFAVLADKKISGSTYENQVKNYCKKVTVVWCCFFIINGSIATYTTFFCSKEVWAVYNGGISYILMGILFITEFIIRKIVDSKMIKTYPISKFNANSRKDDFILCYDEIWSKKNYKTWKDFLIESAKVREFLQNQNTEEYILHCEDYWYFLCVFVALLQCKKTVYLTQNIAENFIKEIKQPGMELLTDQKIENSYFIPDLIQKQIAPPPIPREENYRDCPQIDSEETKIFLFTSGSTGKPTAVPQRLKEFEEDNAFVISKWHKEISSRKLVSTVSQHHIYGFLFGISLPFTLGVPFRRRRVEFPEEFEKMTDKSYIIITTPAFLKRTCESEEKLDMKNVWIFTSGGAVSPQLAEQCGKLFDFYPLEVYGSTETSGIAYRQQNKDGLLWTPFDNAKLWLGEDGCLRVISPYIKNKEGFATSDLAVFMQDGRFMLNGRSDSIVKIEEKRISLVEIENKLLESGFVSDVKVVALQNDVRQYLGAVVVLNKNGKAKFQNCEKLAINRFFHDYLIKYFENIVIPKKWRFVEKIPVDVQGKKHKLEIMAMFENGDKE